MRETFIFMLLVFMVGVFIYHSKHYWMTRKLKFEWIQNITAFRGEKPNSSFMDNNDSYDYYHQNPFLHHNHLKALGNLIQRRLHYFQNPESCNTRRKIQCNLRRAWGFSCTINHIGLCLMIGYATNRTVVVQPSMPSLLQSLSTTCTSAVGTNYSKWRKGAERFQVIDYQVIDAVKYKPNYFAPAIPEDLADRMARYHDNPFLWWAGQISSYVFRPTKAISEYLQKVEAKLGFSSPIVGVHIRRTDKVKREAKYHSLDEYMVVVDKWYDNLEKNFYGISRRLFLATDDPGVKPEMHTRYPKYEVLNNENFTQIAEDIKKRKTNSGYLSVIHDIHMLSKCDYLVCTLSSSVCRLAYQLMQSFRGNATQNTVSLDTAWYFWGTNNKFKTADIVRAKMPLYGDPDVQ